MKCVIFKYDSNMEFSMRKEEARLPTYVVPSGYDIELALSSVGAGWASLIREVFDYKEKMNIPVKIIQVKEKWGGLRIYTDMMHDGFDKMITNIERHSFKVCETCGEPGAVRGNRWYYTACDVHAKKGELPLRDLNDEGF